MVLGLRPSQTQQLCLFIGLLLCYCFLSIWGLREHLSFIGVYLSCFVLTYFFYTNPLTLKQIFISGIIFRLLFLFDLPALSQDYFRFIWDGLLLHEGYNPYRFTPNQWMESGKAFSPALQTELYHGMGELSAQHYSNYPPINQFGFYLSTLISPNSILTSVVCMRLLLILADIGIYVLSRKILPYLNLSKTKVGYYFLNPLIIVELTGNLHWEGVMLFFFALGIYGLLIGKWQRAVVPMVLSVGTKLLPLLSLPLVWHYLKPKKSLLFGSFCALGIGLLFLSFFYGLGYENYFKTLRLWFTTFEFNASFYYIVRAIGYELKGYNIIRSLGKITPFIIIGVVFVFAFFRNNSHPKKWIASMLLLMTTYFFLSTTVHPWYISTLVFLGMLSQYSYPWVWSALVVLSYTTYMHPNFEENLSIISLEYLAVLGVLCFEIRKKKSLFEHLK